MPFWIRLVFFSRETITSLAFGSDCDPHGTSFAHAKGRNTKGKSCGKVNNSKIQYNLKKYFSCCKWHSISDVIQQIIPLCMGTWSCLLITCMLVPPVGTELLSVQVETQLTLQTLFSCSWIEVTSGVYYMPQNLWSYPFFTDLNTVAMKDNLLVGPKELKSRALIYPDSSLGGMENGSSSLWPYFWLDLNFDLLH